MSETTITDEERFRLWESLQPDLDIRAAVALAELPRRQWILRQRFEAMRAAKARRRNIVLAEGII